MHFTTALIATLAALTTTVVAAPLEPILPPKNPSSNGKVSYCTSRTECLQIINNVRADQEGLDPIHLPSNWGQLTKPERLFTFMNLERTSRGLNPLAYLVNTFAGEVATAVSNDADPYPPSSLHANWGSIWAGGGDMIPLAAIYGWMYYDGPGGFNLDCTSSDSSGCWGHRDIILDNAVNAVDVGVGKDSGGGDSMAALLYAADGAPSKAETVLTWAAQKAHVA